MSGVWTMRDGAEIEIRNMTDSHILNSMKMLERSVDSLRRDQEIKALSFFSFVQGEEASYCAERELDALMDLDDADFLEEYTAYGELRDEYEKRKKKGELIEIKKSEKLIGLWKSRKDGV